MPREVKMFARSLRDREVRRGKLVILSLVSALTVAAAAFTATETWAGPNNGFGNGGDDGKNKGSETGNGFSQGGPGAGQPQGQSKSVDGVR